MNYIYHKLPEGMVGTILYPLNKLKDIYPSVFDKQKHKYDRREHVMLQRIPTLNCLWNDVLHFTAINPEDISKALDDNRKSRYYKIDARQLDPSLTSIYLYTKSGSVDEGDFIPYDPDHVNRYTNLPQTTIEYYRKMLAENKRPLLYHLTPHILYKNSLDVSSAEIIEA
jgi:hypothetical protein